MHVIVIGAGVLGANIAYRLSCAGAKVTVVEANTLASGVSGSSFAWLGSFPHGVGRQASSEKELRLQIDAGMRTQTLSDIRALAEEFDEVFVHWVETLTWARSRASKNELRAAHAEASAHQIEVSELNAAEVRELEPRLRLEASDEVFVEASGGWIDVPVQIRALLAKAQDKGGEVLEDTRIARIDRRSGSVTGVTTDKGVHFAADCVVNAAGSWSAHLAAATGYPIPLQLYPGMMVYSKSVFKEPLRYILSAPELLIRPEPNGRIAIHWHGDSIASSQRLNESDPQRVIDQASGWIPELMGTVPSSVRIGMRPVPLDGPIVGWQPGVDGLYLAVSHGGVRWGPTIGRIAAQEIIDRTRAAEFSAMRPSRFTV